MSWVIGSKSEIVDFALLLCMQTVLSLSIREERRFTYEFLYLGRMLYEWASLL